MIRIGIIGAGSMAQIHAEELDKLAECSVVAACDLNQERLARFADKHRIRHVFSSAEEMLNSDLINAVTIVTPDASHKTLTLQALKAGMHGLCEKPLALNAKDAEELVYAAKQSGCINMVNLSYRNAASLQMAHQLVAEGQLGKLRHIEASYQQSWLVSSLWGDWRSEESWLWRLSSAHGSKGVLGDVGVHILDFVSYPAGNIASVHCHLATFNKAKGDRIGDYHLDANDSALITARMQNGAMATIHATRWATGRINDLKLCLYGDQGALKLTLQLDQEWNKLDVCLGENVNEAVWETRTCPDIANIYQRFVTSILTGKQDLPDFSAGLNVQRVLDACEASAQSDRTVTIQEEAECSS